MVKAVAAVSLERSIAVIGAGIVGAAVGLALGVWSESINSI